VDASNRSTADPNMHNATCKLLLAAHKKLLSGTMSQETFDKIQSIATRVNPSLAHRVCFKYGYGGVYLYTRHAAVDADDAYTEELATDLRGLSERGDLKGVRQLLADGADPNTPDAQGTTPLLVAVRCGHVDVVEALVEAGADVDQAGAWDYTPLMYAAIWGQVQIARLLLRYGADKRPRDKLGDTALQHAIMEGQHEIAEMLGKVLDLKARTGTYSLIVVPQIQQSLSALNQNGLLQFL
jgi:ankyrin repeat protein